MLSHLSQSDRLRQIFPFSNTFFYVMIPIRMFYSKQPLTLIDSDVLMSITHRNSIVISLKERISMWLYVNEGMNRRRRDSLQHIGEDDTGNTFQRYSTSLCYKWSKFLPSVLLPFIPLSQTCVPMEEYIRMELVSALIIGRETTVVLPSVRTTEYSIKMENRALVNLVMEEMLANSVCREERMK